MWLNKDPIGEEGGINLYEYVGNNPICLTDALGLKCDDAQCLQAYNSCMLRVTQGQTKDLWSYGLGGSGKGIIVGGIIKGGMRYVLGGAMATPVGLIAGLITAGSSYYLLSEKIEYWHIQADICTDKWHRCRRAAGEEQ